MRDYFQPSFYRFTEDSIWLSREAIKYLNSTGRGVNSILDLCAGSGIIGIECFNKIENVKRLDFCDIQKEFIEIIKKNIKLKIGRTYSGNIYLSSYENLLNLKNSIKYDLIVCNPPYFNEGSGRLSDCDKRNRCRFFLNGSIESLMQISSSLLETQGTFVIVGRYSYEQITSFSKKRLKVLKEIKVTSLASVFILSKLKEN